MTIDRKDTINIPKWLVLIAVPALMSGLGTYVGAKVTQAKYEIEIQNLKQESAKKINKVEADLQFEFIKQQLVSINKKLDVNDLKMDRNEQTTINR